MQISSVKVSDLNLGSVPSFQGKKERITKVKEFPDHYEKSTEVEATTGRKFLAFFSSIVPGLGQFINGQVGKGFLFGGAITAGFVGTLASLIKEKTSKPLLLSSLALMLGSWLWSGIDSVRNATSKVTTVEYKKDVDSVKK